MRKNEVEASDQLSTTSVSARRRWTVCSNVYLSGDSALACDVLIVLEEGSSVEEGIRPPHQTDVEDLEEGVCMTVTSEVHSDAFLTNVKDWHAVIQLHAIYHRDALILPVKPLILEQLLIDELRLSVSDNLDFTTFGVTYQWRDGKAKLVNVEATWGRQSLGIGHLDATPQRLGGRLRYFQFVANAQDLMPACELAAGRYGLLAVQLARSCAVAQQWILNDGPGSISDVSESLVK